MENASDELKDLSNFKLRTRRKQLKQQLARALGMLGIPEAKFHGLASRKQIDEVGLQIDTYCLRPKVSTKSYFMKQKCQIQMGIVKCKNAATPLSISGINTTRQHFQMRYITLF